MYSFRRMNREIPRGKRTIKRKGTTTPQEFIRRRMMT